jgi:hypothetical protein
MQSACVLEEFLLVEADQALQTRPRAASADLHRGCRLSSGDVRLSRDQIAGSVEQVRRLGAKTVFVERRRDKRHALGKCRVQARLIRGVARGDRVVEDACVWTPEAPCRQACDLPATLLDQAVGELRPVHLRSVASELRAAPRTRALDSGAQKVEVRIELGCVARSPCREVAIPRGLGDPLHAEVQLESSGALANATLVARLRHDDRGYYDRQRDP